MGDDEARPAPAGTTRRVLLLGATGFLGSHIREALDAAPATGEVVGYAYGVPPGDPRLRDIDLAAASDDDLDDLLDEVQPDVVVNAAGLTAGSPEALHALNAAYVERLVGALGRRAPGARLVHLGSAAEYGPTVEGRPTAETDEPRPAGPYGETKLAGTRAVQEAAADGLDAVVLRPFNPIGAGMDRRTMPGNAARRLAAAVAAGERVIRMGPLGAYRDFVAAADVASAVVAAAHGADARGRVLNVGSGVARRSRDVVRVLAEAAGYDGAIEEEADEGSARSSAVSWMAADLTRIGESLGWRPVVPFDEAVRALWDSVAAEAAEAAEAAAAAPGGRDGARTAAAAVS